MFSFSREVSIRSLDCRFRRFRAILFKQFDGYETADTYGILTGYNVSTADCDYITGGAATYKSTNQQGDSFTSFRYRRRNGHVVLGSEDNDTENGLIECGRSSADESNVNRDYLLDSRVRGSGLSERTLLDFVLPDCVGLFA